MKKKFSLTILAACLLTTSILAACGGKGSKTEVPPSTSAIPSTTSEVPTSNSSTLSGQGVTTSSHLPTSTSVNPPSTSNQPTSTSTSAPTSTSTQPSSSSSSSSSQAEPFSFTVALSSGTKLGSSQYKLNLNEESHIVINARGGEPGVQRTYNYTSNKREVVKVSQQTGTVTAIGVGDAIITVAESTGAGRQQLLRITVSDDQPADGGYNFASLAGQEAIAKRTEILGALEKNAMDNHLTGITLFENGGYVKYSERVNLPTTNYITGYGFGLLSEGTLSENPPIKEDNVDHKMYLHSAYSQDPLNINSREDKGSQVSDLEGYITSSFWGTKLNSTKDAYEWYPVLAKDTVTFDGNTTPFTRPIPVYNDQEVVPGAADPNPLGLYKTWRIYVKTSELKYRYNGNPWGDHVFDQRQVSIDDYEFAYRFLLTQGNALDRGPEMASDETYGIYGAKRYFDLTEDVSDEVAKNTWNQMKEAGELGLKTGHSDNGDYIQLTILTPIDRFTAMYTLSSNLLSPLPEEFLETIGGGSVKVGAERYGAFNPNGPTGHKNKIVDYVSCTGAYMLEDWKENSYIAFKKNNLWFETGRYFIAGVKLIHIDTSTSTTKIYERFNNGELDSCGIPSKMISVEVNKPRVYKTRGDSTFKLNVNSCTQEMWDELDKNVWKTTEDKWLVKDCMSNDNFLNGLFYSINRKEFASNRGVQPSISYFSDAYLSDPENGVSYNDSQAHKDAISAYQTYDSDGEPTYGYSPDRAVSCFKAAVKELVADGKLTYGTKADPTKIKFDIIWMYQTDIEEYGSAIVKYFTTAFDDPSICDNKVKLEITQKYVSKWDDVYYKHLMIGRFDLGFGAISGNTYNPLNFLEVLKSDNSSTFTLNWGIDTSKVTTNKPLVYNNKIWSFDSLWAVSDHGGIVQNGRLAKTMEKCYMEVDIEGDGNNFADGRDFSVVSQFINSSSVQTSITRIQIYVFGYGAFTLNYTQNPNNNIITSNISLDKATAQEIQRQIRKANKMDNQNEYPDLWNENPFTLVNYNKYWTVELYYSLAVKIEGATEFGSPTETYSPVAKNKNNIKE